MGLFVVVVFVSFDVSGGIVQVGGVVMKKKKKVIAVCVLGLLVAGMASGQLPTGQLVTDILAEVRLATQIATSAQQLVQETNSFTWWSQVFASKVAWLAQLGQAQNSTAANQFTETAGWSLAMATGMNTGRRGHTLDFAQLKKQDSTNFGICRPKDVMWRLQAADNTSLLP
jgi:hypothetical protein